MADVSVKMGVSGLSQFKSSMADAQASVKTLDAALKLNEKQLKANGNAEQTLASQATLLNEKLQKQKEIVKNAEAALKQMEQNGVKTTSKSYQEMQRRMIEARAGMIDTENAISTLGQTALDASEKTSKLESSLGGLNKKVSLEQVRSAIGSITSGMEAAGKKALELGKNLLDGVNSVAANADNILTQAMILDMTPEQYQQYKGVFDTVGEITVQEWQKAKLKVQKAINDPTQDQTDILGLLGISTHEMQAGKFGIVQGAARNFEEVFWDIGETLRKKVESGEMTQDLADTYANAIFGRGFAGLKPIFDLGKDGFTKALKDQATASEEALKKNAEYADELNKVKATVAALEEELISGFTPVLTKAAEAIDGMLTELLAYLKTPEGKQALEDMGKALEGLFGDLTNFDPKKAVEGFKKVFDDIVGGVQWLWEHKGEVVEALKFIVGGWAALKITGGALDVLKLVQGIYGLAGGSAAAEEAGKVAGASWGGAFASAVLKAAPWIAGLIALLNPAEGGNDDLMTPEGQITNEGRFAFMQKAMEDPEYKSFLMELGTYYGQDMLRGLLSNDGALSAIWNYLIGGKQGYNTLGFVNNVLSGYTGGTTFSTDWLGVEFTEEELKEILSPYLTPEIVIPEDAAQKISEEIGIVPVAAKLVPYNEPEDEGGGGGGNNVAMEKANGIWAVPFDGYRAVLHKGERVVPAREVSSRNFSSNLYVESMYMNNGQDAAGLAAAMAAAQRRTMSGYGS